MGIPVFYFFILVIATIYFSSCTKINDFKIGEDFIESQTNLKIIDTFSVDISTILLDSIQTTGSGLALVGNYKDDVFGALNCMSYFEVAYPSFPDLEDKAVFDSAVFVLDYSGYYLGDTTKPFTISIHQVEEEIILDDNGYLYNVSKFDYSPNALGSKTFLPTPYSKEDTVVNIPVNELGEEIFNLVKDNNVVISSDDLFADYIKGFVITSDNPGNNAVLGFTADASNLLFKIYYHNDKETHDKDDEEEISITMGESSRGSYQFNHIDYDFTGTYLEKFDQYNEKFGSNELGNKAYLQGLIGLMPRIQFPTLQGIFLNERWKILKAELVIEPVKNSYDLIDLPADLYLYSTDIENSLGTALKDGSGTAISSTLVTDDLYNEDTRYTFDITSYIINELSDSYVNYKNSFLIGLQSGKISTTVDRLLIDTKRSSKKLRLYYLSY